MQGGLGPYQRIVSEHLQSVWSQGLEGNCLKYQEVGTAPWRCCCKTNLAFLDRVSLLLLLYLFLGFLSEVIYFPSHLCLEVMLLLAGRVGNFSSDEWVCHSLPWNLTPPGTLQGSLLVCLDFQAHLNPRRFSPHMLLTTVLRILAKREMQRLRCYFELG